MKKNEEFKLIDEQLEIIYGGEMMLPEPEIICGVNCFCDVKGTKTKSAITKKSNCLKNR